MDLRLEVSRGAVEKLSNLVSSMRGEDMVEQGFEIPVSSTREEATRYYFILYAIDYGISPGGRRLLEGALWRILEEGRLDNHTLSGINGGALNSLLKPYGVRLPKPEDRAMLLRDLSRKIKSLYNGSYYAVVVESHGQLKYKGGGFIDRLLDFYAYRSPANSKAYRLARKLYMLGVLPAHDLWNAGVSVDSRLTGLALRYGLVRVDEGLLERIALGTPLDPESDRVLRELVFTAYRMLAVEAGVDPFTLDGLLRRIYELYCDYSSIRPGSSMVEAYGCEGLRDPHLWVRDPVPPPGAWWD